MEFTGPGNYKEIEEEIEVTFRNQKFTIKHKCYCNEKGEKFTTNKQDEDAQWAVFRAYWERKGFEYFYDIDGYREEQKSASEDLENKERDESGDELYAIHFEKWGITGECPSELEAKIDAKFGITGRDSNGKPSNGYCDWKKNVFTNGPSIYSFVKLGMDYQKEQMMKAAIEGRLSSTVTGSEQYVSAYVGYGEYGKDGDKVKVIIVKE